MSALPPAEEEIPLPPRPEPGDCCGGGCAVCVLEGYEDELARWEREVAEIMQRNAQPRIDGGS